MPVVLLISAHESETNLAPGKQSAALCWSARAARDSLWRVLDGVSFQLWLGAHGGSTGSERSVSDSGRPVRVTL